MWVLGSQGVQKSEDGWGHKEESEREMLMPYIWSRQKALIVKWQSSTHDTLHQRALFVARHDSSNGIRRHRTPSANRLSSSNDTIHQKTFFV